MFDRFFHLTENKTTVRTELLAGMTTFLDHGVHHCCAAGGAFGRDVQHQNGHGFRLHYHGHVPVGRPGHDHHGPLRPISDRPSPGHGRKFLFRFQPVARRRSHDRSADQSRNAPARFDHPLANRLGRDFLFRRVVFAAFDAGRAGKTHGGHQPQHAQRHRRGHRLVHRLYRAAIHAPCNSRSRHLRENERAVFLARHHCLFLRA